MSFTFFDAVENQLKEIDKQEFKKKSKKDKNNFERIWFEPKVKEGTLQDVLNYYRAQQNKEFSVE